MTHKILIAGFGGQGVMLMGQLLGYSACAAGKQVSFFPAYGAEQRGGTANCTVVISDEAVGASNPRTLDTLVIMNEPSLAKFQGRLRAGGNLILNSNLVHAEPAAADAKVYRIPIVSLAKETTGADSGTGSTICSQPKATGKDRRTIAKCLIFIILFIIVLWKEAISDNWYRYSGDLCSG